MPVLTRSEGHSSNYKTSIADEFRNRALTYVVSFVLRFVIKFDTCQKVSASDIEIEKLWKQSRNLSKQFEPLSAVSRKERMSEQVNLMVCRQKLNP